MSNSIVRPSSTNEVRSLVQQANEAKTPLIPVSSNLSRSPANRECIVDLSQMKRIIRIDRRNRNCMIEPGVTFEEWIPALEKEGLAPLMPFMPETGKSVVASFLDRTPITIPRHHWESQDPLQCVEVVYGNGDLMRTGSAAGPGTLEEQWQVGRAQVRGMGPSQVDFTRLLQGAQGTLGIVTWATIRCRPLPVLRKCFLVVCDELKPLIELTYRITYKKLGEELLILNRDHFNAAAGMHPEKAWVLYLSIEGDGFFPEAKVHYQENEIAGLVREAGLPFDEAESSVNFSRPSGKPCWKDEARGGHLEVFFITTLDRSPGFISKMRELSKEAPGGMGVYIQPIIQGCNCHLEFSLPFDPKDEQETRNAEDLADRAARQFAGMGGFFSRPYGKWAQFAFDSEGMHVSGLNKVKEIFDPNGIMSPGRLCY